MARVGVGLPLGFVPGDSQPASLQSLSPSTTLFTSSLTSTAVASIPDALETGSSWLNVVGSSPRTVYDPSDYTSAIDISEPKETGGSWPNPFDNTEETLFTWPDLFGPTASVTYSPISRSNNTRTDPSYPAVTDPDIPFIQVCEIRHPHKNPLIEDRCVSKVLFHGGLVWAMGLACWVMVAICGLLAGLTLAICSLDETRLHVLSKTGKNEKADKNLRKMAKAVKRMRKQESWLLCSMILLSVLCNESVPHLLGVVYPQAWRCMFVSTAILAVFGELIPQAFIPRYALMMAYYFRFFIWATMFIMAPVSYPIAWALDRFTNPQPCRINRRKTMEKGIYTHEQLCELLRYHERAEKNDGLLGHDASRVARGALSADYDTIGGGDLGLGRQFKRKEFKIKGIRANESKNSEEGLDLEKGGDNWTHHNEIFTPWANVKKIHLGDKVDDEFIQNVISYRRSRLPVVKVFYEVNGMGQIHSREKVAGYLHTRSLIGLQIIQDMTVQDLKIYPIPIVFHTIPIFDMLNIFQTGCTQIAAVCASPVASKTGRRTKHPNKDYLPKNQSTSLLQHGLHARHDDEMYASRHFSKDDTIDGSESIPIGIITYQDCVDAILQKTSWDEYDFDRKLHAQQPPSNLDQFDDHDEKPDSAKLHSDGTDLNDKSVPSSTPLGDDDSTGASKGTTQSKKVIEPADLSQERHNFQKVGVPELRSILKRKVDFGRNSKSETLPTGFDGTDDRWMLGLDGTKESVDFGTQLDDSFRTIIEAGDNISSHETIETHDALTKENCRRGSSSYTTNSEGGWHSKSRGHNLAISSTLSLFPTNLSPEDLRLLDPTITPILVDGNLSTPYRTFSMPSLVSSTSQGGMIQAITRYASASAANLIRMPKLRRVEPFVRDESGNVAKRSRESHDSADYSIKTNTKLSENINKDQNLSSYQLCHSGSAAVSNSSNKENLAPDDTMKSLAKLVKTRLQISTESGDTISLTPTSCFGDLDGADIMTESWMTRRSIQTNRPSMEVAPLFSSILGRLNPPKSEENEKENVQVKVESVEKQMQFQMPKVYFGAGAEKSGTLQKNNRKLGTSGRSSSTTGVDVLRDKMSFEIGDDRRGLPSQRGDGVRRRQRSSEGRLEMRSGGAAWWV